TPGRTNIWEKFIAVRDQLGTEVLGAGAGCIGSPEQLRVSLRKFQDAGVDQTVFIQQGGNNKHEHICESLKCFAKEVMPEFRKDEVAREAKKQKELAPFIEAAFKRKKRMQPLERDRIPSFPAYGLTAPPVDLSTLPEANRQRALVMRKMREIAEKSGNG